MASKGPLKHKEKVPQGVVRMPKKPLGVVRGIKKAVVLSSSFF
jgi:hypothetical protein